MIENIQKKLLNIFGFLLLLAHLPPLFLPHFIFNKSWSNLYSFRNTLFIFLGIQVLLAINKNYRSLLKNLIIYPEKIEFNEKSVIRVIFILFLLIFMNFSYLKYVSFELDGVPFSLFDHLFSPIAGGSLMMSDLIPPGVKFFAHHASWALFFIYPFHSIFNSPFFLVLFQGVILWSGGIFWYKYLTKNLNNSVQKVMLLLAFFHIPILADILNYGFQIEWLYLPFFFMFFYFLDQRKLGLIYLSFLLIHLVKEDAALYLVGVLSAWFIFEKWKRGHVVVMIFISIAVFGLNNFYFMPMYRTEESEFLGVISKYGDSFSSILVGMLSSPIEVFKDVISGGWLKIVGFGLFLPIFNLPFWISGLPYIIIHSTSPVVPMKNSLLYYSAPFLPLFFISLFWVFKQKLFNKIFKKFALNIIIFLITFMCLFVGGGYLKSEVPHPDYQEIPYLVQYLDNELGSIYLQSSVIPHFPYWERVHWIRYKDISKVEGIVVINPNLKEYTLGPQDKPSLFQQVNESKDFIKIDNIGNFHIYKSIKNW